MKLKLSLLMLSLFFMNISTSQNKELPYYEISDYPSEYNEGTVVARMIDGLGFRYYWATEGLRAEDLTFKPSEDARTTGETVDHILGLTNVILNSALKKVNEPLDTEGMSFSEKRTLTLNMLKQAADIFRSTDDLSQFKIVFKGENGNTEYPFWNQINGPIADALWHCGQIITHRRTSGNPYNSKASVFTGKVRN
ncbi:MAG: hypothetical protein R2785_10180 [Flavobacteriaceae bacterium]